MLAIQLLAAWVVTLPSPARAADLDWLTQHKQPNLHYGELAITPYYQLGEAYDSNIYLNPPGQSINGGVLGSWITTNDFGFDADLPFRHLHDLSAGYDFADHAYSTQPSYNNTINQHGHLDYSYAGAHGLTFKTGDYYENTTDQAFSELTQRARRWMNIGRAGLRFERPGGRLTAGIDGSQETDKYLDPDFAQELNRYDQIGALDLGYKIEPKTTLYTVYRRELIHYTVHRQLPDQDKDSKSDDGAVGISGTITPKITGKAEAGLTYRAYDEPPIGGGSSRVTRNLTGMANLRYEPSVLTDIKLTLYRRLEESVSDASRFYISQGIELDVRRRILQKFTFGVNGGFELDKYPDLQPDLSGALTQRLDDNYFAGALVVYDIQAWLSTGVSYSLRQRDSTISDEFAFQDQVTSWNAVVRF